MNPDSASSGIKMARCSLRRCAQLLCLALSCSLLSFLVYNKISTSERSVQRYQVEQKATPTQLWKNNLDPQTKEEKEEEKMGFTRNGFNQFRSDRIPLDREIPDTRDLR